MPKRKQPADSELPDARKALLDAAEHLFAECGYSATGVQEITDRAGVNKAMLYYYFGSKDGIFDKLIAEGSAGLEQAVTAAEQPGLTLAGRLQGFLTAYLTLVAHRPALARIVYREIVGAGERDRERVTELFSESIRRLGAVLAVAQQEGDLREVDPTLSAYTLVGMANVFISSFFLTGRLLEIPVLVEHIVTLFIHGIARNSQGAVRLLT